MKESNINRILYEDNHLLIANKQPGEIVQGDKTGDEPLVESLKSYLKVKYDKPGDVFLGVVHRLDRPVSGALIFARTSKALSRMNEQMKTREVKKVYWAIVASRQSSVGSRQSTVSSQQLAVENHVEWNTLVNYLKRNEQQNKSYVFDLPGEGRQRAEMRYRTLASGDRYDLLEVELMTGRHHQIRAQLSAIGLPIKGDLKYGSPRSNPDGAISLHSRFLEFMHPVKQEKINITVPVPGEKLWNDLLNLYLSNK
jgi:23S rRNA pseudouridine1911/1915/1917 synthase